MILFIFLLFLPNLIHSQNVSANYLKQYLSNFDSLGHANQSTIINKFIDLVINETNFIPTNLTKIHHHFFYNHEDNEISGDLDLYNGIGQNFNNISYETYANVTGSNGSYHAHFPKLSFYNSQMDYHYRANVTQSVINGTVIANIQEIFLSIEFNLTLTKPYKIEEESFAVEHVKGLNISVTGNHGELLDAVNKRIAIIFEDVTRQNLEQCVYNRVLDTLKNVNELLNS